MASVATALGLGSSSGVTAIPNHAAYYTIFNFFLSYLATSPRGLKQKHGIDHNVNPREDIDRFGEKAVQDGKLTRDQLNIVKRCAAAHANSMEHFPVFVGSVLFALVARVPLVSLNRACAVYSVSRVAYCWAYLTIDHWKLSYIRSAAWWSSSLTCLYLLGQSGKNLNAGL